MKAIVFWKGAWRDRGRRRRGRWPGPGGFASPVEALELRALLSGVTAEYAVTQDWGSGFQASVRLENSGPAAVDGWTLEFDSETSITSIWDARVVSHTGTHYVLNGAGWNDSIAAGGSVTFGYVANPGSSVGAPRNLILNGMPLGGGPSGTLPTLSVADVSAAEGDAGTTGFAFVVTRSGPSSGTVTIDYATADGTAREGEDYSAVRGRLTFAPGEMSKTIVVSVMGDAVVEADEAFVLGLSAPSCATLARAVATGTIRNDDAPTAQAPDPVAFRVVSDWGSGFTGEVTVGNPGGGPASGWTLAFDFAGQIGSIWNARVLDHSGTRYVVQGESWNATIPARGSVSFGFTASPGGGAAVPTGFALDGLPTDGGATNRNPTAVGDAAVTPSGVAVEVAVLANDTDADGDRLSVISATPGHDGSVVRNADGTVTYAPRAGFVGTDSFSYTVSDGRGGTASAAVSVSVTGAAVATDWPVHTYAPYVDMTLYPTPDLVRMAREQGLRYFTLAFVAADPHGKPSWGGYSTYGIDGSAFDQGLRDQIFGLRARGGDVMVSFGGANGQELAQSITDVVALEAAYRSVIDAYGLTHLDFDIEGWAAADRSSIDRRSQALAALQREAEAAGRPLEIWLTLPVLPTGLTADGLYVVRSAVEAGVRLAGVNVMAMDYGDSAAPSPAGRMGEYAIQAATSTFDQLKDIYGASRTDAELWGMVGVTPMIGLNDVTTERFDPQDASELLAFARSHGLRRISIWSLNRDRPNRRGAISYVEPTSSSLAQEPYEFSVIFKPFSD